MSIQRKKHEMPLLPRESRICSFDEVALGYSEEIAIAEADRCLNCVNQPCVRSCPVNIAIPDFISKIKQRDFKGAYDIISENSLLPAICGRVCPQETQCEGSCTLGIKFEPVAIGRLERFVADCNINSADKINRIESKNKKIAVVGSGPAGLACAGTLAKKGYEVTVFEALHRPGGVLTYGIPEFRLPKYIVEREIETLKKYGVNFVTNTVIGKTITVDELFEDGFKAVFLGTGAGLPRFMNISGENLNGVYSANEFLTRVNLMKAYEENSNTPVLRAKRVAVIGGGNVAMDAARTALRLGAESVKIIYRRSMEELPARKEEVEHAKEEGIEFDVLRNPVEIIPSDTDKEFVAGIKLIKCELGEPDERGRRRPIELPDSEYIIEVDSVIIAIGTTPNPLIRSTSSDIKFNMRGGIIINDKGETTKSDVYAGGDAVTGAATVILAMSAGKEAALSIDEKLSK